MPRRTRGEGGHGTYRLYGSPADLEAHLAVMHPVERRHVEAFQSPRRRAASAAARSAAHAALDAIGVTRAVVVCDDYGAPVVLDAESGLPIPDCSISIAHRSGVAVALVDSHIPAKAIGIDLEVEQPGLLRIQEDFFTRRERNQVAAVSGDRDRVSIATMVWTAKEASAKAAGLGFALAAGDVEVMGSGRAVVRGLRGVSLDLDLSFWRAAGMRACAATVVGRTLAEVRALRPPPRRSFAWTGVLASFVSSATTRLESDKIVDGVHNESQCPDIRHDGLFRQHA